MRTAGSMELLSKTHAVRGRSLTFGPTFTGTATAVATTHTKVSAHEQFFRIIAS